MLALRRLDAPGRRAYLDELRPRLVVVRVRARGRHIVWAVPLWPFEQLLALVLGLALLAPSALQLLPERARSRLRGVVGESVGDGVASMLGHAEPGTLLESLSLIAAGGLGDALRLPPGEPYLSVRTPDVDFDITPY